MLFRSFATYLLVSGSGDNFGSYVCYWNDTNGDYLQGTLTSYDADGFTISWVKVGTLPGTMYWAVLCLK